MHEPPTERKIKRLLIVTDAWQPQVNGVVRTLGNTRANLQASGVQVEMLTPLSFKTLPCPSYPEIRLSLTSARRVQAMIEQIDPDALHIATEGPLGWAARRVARRQGWAFTTAYHTRFPEYVKARIGVPLDWSYALLRRFHGASSAVLAPTPAIVKDLQDRGFHHVVHWSRGVAHDIFYPRMQQEPPRKDNPVFLYAGRLAIEKNVEAFLKLDLPGQKWVAGEGPMAEGLKRQYPNARYIGVIPQEELAKLYSQADVFVFPSLTDTFGLVMVEAMACGLPVAAYPVAGPIDVVGDSGAGVLHDDLKQACLACLNIDRSAAIHRAAQFTWPLATQQFYDALTPMRRCSA
ncbi:glycosyltransferase family 4 protein [Orrella daihaiensis]|uniref:glycosyltransferase family 4 protein n=1 Tax=Orrella daihaiensis TaxID=2782176 RepID=UPI001FB53AC7|nr:glycosyltransferase family 1 protein [Orrella daihaiensis]